MAGVRYVTRSSLGACTARWLAALAPWNRSRPLPALDHAALLVLDLQRYFAESGSHAYLPAVDAVLPNILELVQAFRRVGRPVVLTRHGSAAGDASDSMMRRWWRDDLRRGEPRGELVQQLNPSPADLVLDKSRYSAFAGTELQQWLARRGCETVVIAGVMTHLCCETTARDAFMRNLAPVVLADACATQDEELHLGALRGLAHGFAVVSSTGQLLGQLPGHTTTPQAGPAPAAPPRVELAIVGAGPAGVAAAIQAARAGVELCLLDPAGFDGAQAHTANHVENYPGFPGGTPGAALWDRFVAQAREHDLTPLPHRVTAVETAGQGLTLTLDSGQTLTARAVILATGAAPRRLELPLPPEAPLYHRADALPRVRGLSFLVLGGGEAALDQALWLHRHHAAAVAVALRGAAPRAMDLLVHRARQQEIELLPRTELAGLRPGQDGAWIAALRRPDGALEREVAAVLVCIGKRPRGPRLPAALGGGLPRVDRLGRTPVPGLYQIGDCCRGRYRQVAIAVGDGVAAAMHAAAYLGGGDWETTS